MRWGKLSIILVLTGGIVGFNFAFKNLLIKRLMESALQTIFQAKAEVRGVHFELFGARLKFKQLIVANKDKPMYNLFELGQTEFNMNSAEMLKGKVVIENLECQGIQWDTAREKSGALPHSKKKPDKQGDEQQPGIMDIAKVNAEELLAEHMAELKSLDFLSNANQELEDFNQSWSNRIETSKKTVDNLESGYNRVKSINVTTIKTLVQATKTLKDINDFQKTLTSARNDVLSLKSGISADLKKAKSTIKQSRTVVKSDLDYLKSLISIPEGGAKGLIKSMLRKVLADQLGGIYYYANEALGYTQALNKSTPKSKKEQKKMMKAASLRRPGYDVYFPGNGYPDFLVQHLGTSISNTAEDKYLLVDIKDISSDFNLWNKPLTYSLDRQDQGMGLHLEGLIDPRTNSNQSFVLALNMSSIPFVIQDDLSFMNIVTLKGKYTLDTSLALTKDKSNAGRMYLVLREVEIVKGDQPNTVSDIIFDILSDSSTIDFNISYQLIQPEGRLEFQVSSSLDGIVQARIGKLIDDMVGDATSKLSAELNILAGPLLEQNGLLSTQTTGMESGLNENGKRVDAYQGEVDSKKNAVKQKMGQLKSGVVTDKIPGGIKLPKF